MSKKMMEEKGKRSKRESDGKKVSKKIKRTHTPKLDGITDIVPYEAIFEPTIGQILRGEFKKGYEYDPEDRPEPIVLSEREEKFIQRFGTLKESEAKGAITSMAGYQAEEVIPF